MIFSIELHHSSGSQSCLEKKNTVQRTLKLCFNVRLHSLHPFSHTVSWVWACVMSIPKSAKQAPSSGLLMFSRQIWDANFIDNSKIGDEFDYTYFWQLVLFKFIPYLGYVSQICISDLPWKHQQTTRWRLFSRLWYRH